ncbi:hypothetical protein ZIOFF_034661 [Zingiber officinale]|uniref:Uncharacterized protein n=1 Tax=Zingiber officinale TaxID=94328 RepID=A0A8J5GSF4_ZINOF|nr:hypothetical protein ZIOFF_034661 [Zingiber officinale]
MSFLNTAVSFPSSTSAMAEEGKIAPSDPQLKMPNADDFGSDKPLVRAISEGTMRIDLASTTASCFAHSSADFSQQDPSFTLRKALIYKIHKLLNEQAMPDRYACAFALASMDCLGQLRDDSMKFLNEFLKMRSRQCSTKIDDVAQKRDAIANTKHLGYVVVFLIHVLAHDKNFPLDNCQDYEAYVEFLSPLIIMLQALVHLGDKQNDVSQITSYMLGIFSAIQKADDVVDAICTHKLHVLSKIGSLAIKHLTMHCKISLDASHLVLLPSLYFKVCHDANDQGRSTATDKLLEGGFVRQILSIFESYINQALLLAASEGSMTVSADLAAGGMQKHQVQEGEDPKLIERLSNKQLLLENIDYAIDLFLIYVLTLSPGFLSETQAPTAWAHGKDSHNSNMQVILTLQLYALVLIAMYNVWDLIGRYIPLLKPLVLSSRKGLIAAILSGFLLIPAFYFTVKYGDQGWMIMLTSFLGLSNGYFTVCVLTTAPKGYKRENKILLLLTLAIGDWSSLGEKEEENNIVVVVEEE